MSLQSNGYARSSRAAAAQRQLIDDSCSRSGLLRSVACCLIAEPVTGLAGSRNGTVRILMNSSDCAVILAKCRICAPNFSQQVIGPDEEIIEQASGSVALSKPGRFRWDYREPYERIIVADGERVWFYEADLEQVTIRRISRQGLGDTPAAHC